MSDIFEKELSELQNIYELLTELSNQKDQTSFVYFFKENVREKLSQDSLNALDLIYVTFSEHIRDKYPEINEALSLLGRVEAWNGTIKNIRGPLINKFYNQDASNPDNAESIVAYAKNITGMSGILDELSEWNDAVRENINKHIKYLPTPEDLSLVKHNKSLKNIVNTIHEYGFVSKESMKEGSKSMLKKHGIISMDNADRVFLTNKGINLYRMIHADISEEL